MEFGISFGGGSPNKPHKVALNYPASPSKRTPRFLLSSGHAGRRAASEDTRHNKHRNKPVPQAIVPAHAISISRKPVKQAQSSIHPHESASQVPTERPRPRRSSSLNVLAGSYTTIRQQPPHPERTIEARPSPPQRMFSRQEIERKPLPEVPSRFRLGEAGMPWDSPHMPLIAVDGAYPEQQQSATYSARSASSPSDLEQKYVGDFQRRSVSSPTTPIISPQSSHASTHKGAGHSRMISWGFTSAGCISPNLTTASSKSTIKGKMVANPPPLRGSPPDIPLPLVPRSPPSQIHQQPAVETPVLEPGTGHEETEDEAIKRELQEAKDARRLTTDPQRARELGELNAAMVGFEALDDRFYEPVGTWDTSSELAGLPRGSQSLGWAIRVEPEMEQADAERRAARRKAKGKEPRRGERVANGNGSRSGPVDRSDSRPSSSGSEAARERERVERGARVYYVPDDVGALRESAWQEYSTDDWEAGDGESSIWRGIERRRSWTSGEDLEWQGQYWSAITYR